MRGVIEETISLLQAFFDEPDFAVFEVADSAMNHVRRTSRGSRGKITLFDKGDVHSGECELSQGGESVDATPNDEHSCRWRLGKRFKQLSARGR